MFFNEGQIARIQADSWAKAAPFLGRTSPRHRHALGKAPSNTNKKYTIKIIIYTLHMYYTIMKYKWRKVSASVQGKENQLPCQKQIFHINSSLAPSIDTSPTRLSCNGSETKFFFTISLLKELCLSSENMAWCTVPSPIQSCAKLQAS